MRLKFSTYEQVAKEQSDYLSSVLKEHAFAPKLNKAEYNSKMIVVMYKQGKSKKEIMTYLNVTRRQVDHRIAKYYETGSDCILKAGPKGKFEHYHYEWVKQTMIDHRGELELLELKELFDEHFAEESTKISVTTLFKMLKHANIKLITRKIIKQVKVEQERIDMQAN